MNTETKEILIQHIKSRQNIEAPMVSVQKMLDCEGVGLFTKVCCNRIIAAGLVDEDHVVQAWTGKEHDLHMDAEGIKKCREILEGYVSPEELQSTIEAYRYAEEFTISNNNMLYMLRKYRRRDLRQMKRELLEELQEGESDIPELISYELRYRYSVYGLSRYWTRFCIILEAMKLINLSLQALPILIRFTWKALRDREYECRGVTDGKYYKALKRFQQERKKCDKPEKMKREDLVSYIYLGVKTWGKEYFRGRERRRKKSCEEIEKLYQECSKIMKAIGRLTPMELQQMFPIKKEFDGKRWEAKDYFYTREAIERLEPDKPIGNEMDAADLLWEYVNDDLTSFFFNWTDVIDDLHIHCYESGPYNEFYKERKSRKQYERKMEGKTDE